VVGDTTVESNETVILTMGAPTNATLGANTVYTHTILNDDATAPVGQPTGVYLPDSTHVTLGSARVNGFGGAGQESVILAAAAKDVTLDQNIDRVYLSQAASAYRYQQTGNQINLYPLGSTELILKIPLQTDADGTVFVFQNGTASARLASGVMSLGGATVAAAAPTALSPTLGAVLAAPGGDSAASAFLGTGASFTAASTGLRVYGGIATETLEMAQGTRAVVADQNVEAVRFEEALGRYTFQQTGNLFNVFDSASGERLLRLSVQTDADGTQCSFAGTSYSATLSGGVMRLGAWVMPSAAPGRLPPVMDVAVSGPGSSTAASGDVRYTFSVGSYAYTIAGFGRGDVLDFPVGADPSVSNESFTDGQVTLSWALSGQTVTVTLTGLASTQDAQLFAAADFNTVFGAGTVV
jgi:hypothetical protein